MIPQDVTPGRFTRQGRLAGRWAAALAEPDPYLRLRALLDLVPAFSRRPGPVAELWPPFLDSVLRGPHAAQVTQADLADLETAATTVAEGSKGRLSLAEAWFPLLLARDARGEHQVVTAMLTRLYRSPDLPPSGKTAVARKLALRGAVGDEHLAVYVDYLADAVQDEPAVTALLTRCMVTGYDVPPAQVRRAGDLAQRLRDKDVTVPGADLALGYAGLLLDRDAERAVTHLTAAHHTDRRALPGLLSALVRTGDHERVAALTGDTGDPVVRGLAELSTTLRWLDEPALPGLAPSTAARLAALPVGVHAGEWLGYAIGRLHLIEGATRAAATTLVAVADRCPEQRHWNYHAAWALHLLDDRHGVARRYELADGWDERWTVGLVLTDTDPARTPDHTGLTPLHARVVDTRMAMRPPRQADLAPVEITAPESMAVRLEALRTNLGVHVARHDTAALTEAMADPVFSRLPLPDQLLWAGLARPGDTGDALLAQAADGFGYRRAGLVRTVRELRRDRVPDPAWLSGLSWRDDATVEIVRAWTALVAGDVDDAKTRLAGLDDDPRAQYVLGTAWLLTTGDPNAFGHAAAAFTRAVVHGGDLPGETELMMRCAALAADPDGPVGDLDGSGNTPWTVWTVALTGLHRDPAAVPTETYERLVTQLEKAEAPATAAALVVATGLANASMRSERTDDFLTLLDRVARTAPGEEVTRLRALLHAGAVRNGRKLPDGHHGAPTALVLAERALADGRPAVEHLRTADYGPGAGFCRTLADFLADEPVTPPPEDDSAAADATGLLVTVASATDDAVAGLDHVLTVLRTRDLSGVVDLSRVLPALCARANRNRQVPPQLENLVRTAVAAGTHPPAVLAQCASAVGARDLSLSLHRQAFKDDPATGPSYAATLRHEAALARRAGDERRALDSLLRAAQITAGGGKPLPDGDLTTTWILEQVGMLERADAPEAVLAKHALYELCVSRLLTHIFGEEHANRGSAGRLTVLEGVVAGSHTLRTGLLDGDPRTVRKAWRNAGTARSRDLYLQHTLAVLYREHALGTDTIAAEGARTLAVATALWSLLLSTERFWLHAGERAEAEEPRLRESVCRELFVAHGARGRRALTAGDLAAATAHLRCLTDYDGDPARAVATVDDVGLRYRHDVDTDRFSRVCAIAAEVLGEWVDDEVRAATAVLENGKDLEPDYAGAVAALGPFLALGVPVPAILRTALDWYNKWCFAEYQRENQERVAELTSAAAKLADKLIPLCTKGQGLRPENQVLSQHIMFRGFAATDHDKAVQHYKSALAWNPGNANAQQLLDQRAEFEIEERLSKAARAIEDGRYDAALAQLKSIDAKAPDLRLAKERLVNAAKLRAAVDKKQWTTAERVLREEMAGASPADRKVIASQLAGVLNTHAVELVDKAKPFADALTAVFGQVRARANNPFHDDDRFGGHPYESVEDTLRRHVRNARGGTGLTICAVCDGASSIGRAEVVNALVRKVRSRGEVRAQGVVAFWTEYERWLCGACKSALRGLPDAQRTAVTLLTEGRRLDPRNQVIRKNLDQLRKDL